MPLRPTSLRLLRQYLSVTRLTSMSKNPNSTFPSKLKNQTLGAASASYSTRSRPDNRGPKSLVDDEEELSNWVSGLRTSSFRAGVLTDDEEDIDRGLKSKRIRARDSDDDDVDEGRSPRRGGSGSGSGRYNKRGREGDSYNGVSSREDSRFGNKDRKGGLRGGSYNDESSLRNSRGVSRGGGGFERRGGGRGGGREFEVRNGSGSERGGGRGREREFEVRNGSGSGRGGGRGGGQVGFMSKEKVVEEELGGYESRKGEKTVSGFLDLVEDEDSSDEDESEDEDEDDDEEIEVKTRNEGVKPSPLPPTSTRTDDSYLSETRFDQCSVSPLSLKAIKDVGYERLTMVQEATLPVILKGKDVMAKARTGTGKTVAFLLPSIEVVTKTPPAGRDQNRPPFIVLVICPTRELASQAAAEANTLVKYHPSIGVQVVIGGTKLSVEQKRMQSHPSQILVATPGRFRDHLENTAGFATRLKGVKVLVLDEADHLLDMGFRKDIEKIVSAVPQQRQTLLFSATIADEVRQICHIALKRDYEYINTVQEGSGDTHSQVRQTHLVAPLENQFSLLYAILKDHISDDVNYKVLVFCTTAMVTRLVADFLGELNLNVREIHSRKPQSYRTRVSDEFRKSKGLILVTSDVSARGVDYPDVTLVIQVGLPSDREQYIHRLGRTGRKGKEGQGILILGPWEESFLNTIKDLPISKATPPLVDPNLRKKVERALSNVEMKNKEAAYQAWLGYYNSNKVVGRDKNRLVELANEFSRSMGLDNPPAIPKLVLGKMGLKNVLGLRSK